MKIFQLLEADKIRYKYFLGTAQYLERKRGKVQVDMVWTWTEEG